MYAIGQQKKTYEEQINRSSPQHSLLKLNFGKKNFFLTNQLNWTLVKMNYEK